MRMLRFAPRVRPPRDDNWSRSRCRRMQELPQRYRRPRCPRTHRGFAELGTGKPDRLRLGPPPRLAARSRPWALEKIRCVRLLLLSHRFVRLRQISCGTSFLLRTCADCDSLPSHSTMIGACPQSPGVAGFRIQGTTEAIEAPVRQILTREFDPAQKRPIAATLSKSIAKLPLSGSLRE